MSKPINVSFPTSLRNLVVLAVALPLFGFVFCITWSVLYNFEVTPITKYITIIFCEMKNCFQSSTHTHCDVTNFAPSISTAIGGYSPQKFIWQTCISLHIAPRFVFLIVYKNLYEVRLGLLGDHYSRPEQRLKHVLLRIAILCHLLELFSLLGLTLVTSYDNFDVHKICFATFGISSLIYLGISYFLWTQGRRPTDNAISISVKRTVLKLFFGFGCLLSYFYYLHNTYCYPYVYSLFCICEYVIVIANMVFHLTAYFDFAYVKVVTPCTMLSDYYQPLRAVNVSH